jgi:hypothetical protein
MASMPDPIGKSTTKLREINTHAKLVSPIELEWRNWQTQQTQNLPPVTRRGGSTPPSSTSPVDVQGFWHNGFGVFATRGRV